MSKNKPDTVIVRCLVEHQGQYLVLQKSETSDRAGEWEVPGGKLDPGETLERGVHREVMEETGLDLDGFEYDKSNSYIYDSEERLSVIFRAASPSKAVKLSREHQDFRWIDSSNYNNIELNKVYNGLFTKLFKSDEKKTTTTRIDAQDTTNIEHIIIYTDGGSRGNPGPSASGFVIMDEDEHVLEEGGEYLGITTNNQAEYQAVKQALQSAKKFSKGKVDFFIDSLLVVNQMNGIYKIRNRDLWPIHDKINTLAKDFKEVTFTHVRREFNSLADAKVNEVLDSYNHRETEQ